MRELCAPSGQHSREAAGADTRLLTTWIQTILKSAGWDGEWFFVPTMPSEKKIGSIECEEGQIFIEPQGFCVLAGVGVKEGIPKRPWLP